MCTAKSRCFYQLSELKSQIGLGRKFGLNLSQRMPKDISSGTYAVDQPHIQSTY
jgi:hypothetical protein